MKYKYYNTSSAIQVIEIVQYKYYNVRRAPWILQYKYYNINSMI